MLMKIHLLLQLGVLSCVEFNILVYIMNELSSKVYTNKHNIEVFGL